MKRNTKELINMLSAAGLVLLTLLLALGVHACRNTEAAKARRAQILRAGSAPATETHTLTVPPSPPPPLPWGDAPPLPSAAPPLSREALARVRETLVVLAPTLDGAEPVFSATPGLLVSPSLLAPLSDLATAFHAARPRETLHITAAFAPDATSPFATGLSVSLSVRYRTDAGTTETVPLADLPDAAATLAAQRARHGFISLGADGGDLCLVGYPHAALMEERHLTPAQYLTYLSLFSQEEPLTARVCDRAYRVFYLPAEDGRASLTLPRDTPFSVLPVGSAGFLVVLPGDT